MPPSLSAFQPSAVIDSLAERGWAVWEGFLTPGEVRFLAREVRALWTQQAFRPAGVGHGPTASLRPELRSDYLHWLDAEHPTQAQSRFLAKMEGLRLAINQVLFLGLLDFEVHLAVYPPGACYRRHLDRFRGTHQRILSCIVYLNQHWQAAEGGQLRLYMDHEGTPEWIDILPTGGTLVAFLSERFPHEVLPATRERLSITGWFTARR